MNEHRKLWMKSIVSELRTMRLKKKMGKKYGKSADKIIAFYKVLHQ